METALNQIRELYAKGGPRERQQIDEQLRDFQRELQTDSELLFSIACGVSVLGTELLAKKNVSLTLMQPLIYALVQVGFDLSIFTEINTSSTPVSHQVLVQKTGAAPNLLHHYLRAMSSFGLISEVSKDNYAANRTTKILSQPNVIGANIHISDVHYPVLQALPSYLKSHKYQDMTNIKDLPFQQAKNTDLEPFEWMKQRPEQMKGLGHIMSLEQIQSWVFSYPIEEEVGSFKPAADSALLVDIGGGFGQHTAFFKNKYPQLPGRLVVQDVPATLMSAPKAEGVEFSAYDFFTPQPIKHAKFYYLRNILHDWTDEESIRILSNIIPAMGPESRIVIEEMVLPETKLPWQAAMVDIMLMACLGGIERTKEDWEKLLTRAGLSIVNVLVFDQVKFHGVIMAVPKAA